MHCSFLWFDILVCFLDVSRHRRVYQRDPTCFCSRSPKSCFRFQTGWICMFSGFSGVPWTPTLTPATIVRILQSRRASTLSTTRNGTFFAAWCMSRDEDPVHLEPSVMCVSFLSIEIKKLQPITIIGYRSAIARVIDLVICTILAKSLSFPRL